MVHYPKPFKKEICYFWGYRNHTIIDAETELSLWEKTLPANKSEVRQAFPLLKELIERHSLLGIEAVLGDAICDTEDILKFIIKELKAKAAIPRRSPGEKKEGFYFQKNKVYCPADIAMLRKGRMTVDGVTYLQYACPTLLEQEDTAKISSLSGKSSKVFQPEGLQLLSSSYSQHKRRN